MEADRRQFTDPGDGEAEYTQPTSPLPSLSPSHWVSADYPHLAAPNSAQGQGTCRCKGSWAQRREESRAGCVCEGWGGGQVGCGLGSSPTMATALLPYLETEPAGLDTDFMLRKRSEPGKA